MKVVSSSRDFIFYYSSITGRDLCTFLHFFLQYSKVFFKSNCPRKPSFLESFMSVCVCYLYPQAYIISINHLSHLA
jgi:hypothetical protein